MQETTAHRSAVTNATRSFIAADGRSRTARRMRDLQRQYEDDFRGDLTAAALQSIRRAASLSTQLELMDAAIARGEVLDLDAQTRMNGQLRRTLRDLGLLVPPERARHNGPRAPSDDPDPATEELAGFCAGIEAKERRWAERLGVDVELFDHGSGGRLDLDQVRKLYKAGDREGLRGLIAEAERVMSEVRALDNSVGEFDRHQLKRRRAIQRA